jgi:2'-5' RNA ligase
VNQDFINAAATIAWDDIDFNEWHGGVKHYGFWALIIDDSEWLEAVNQAASYLSPYVLAGYRRQPHVSLIAGGLMSDQNYSAASINKHKQALIKANISPFSISLAGLDSFTSAPYLTVVDDSGSLEYLRAQLLASASEDNLDSYQAHITLGLYNGEFSTIALGKTITGFDAPVVKPLIVSEVKFCSYQTNDIQGRITVLDSIEFNNS